MINLSLKFFLTVAILLFCKTSALAESQDEIRAVFERYREAILSRNGREALKWVSSGTVKLYAELKDLALNATRDKTLELQASDRLVVLRLRLSISRDKLASMSPEEIFIHGVSQGYSVFTGTESIRLDKVVVSGLIAYATFLNQVGHSTQSFKPWLAFTYNQGSWKIELSLSRGIVNSIIRSRAHMAGLEENEYLLRTIESVHNLKADQQLFDAGNYK